LKKRIRTYLANLAPDLAAKTFSFLFEQKRSSAWMQEERESSEFALVHLIRRFAEWLETGKAQILEKEFGEYAYECTRKGVPLGWTLERLRTCRDIIVEQMNADTTYLARSDSELTEFFRIQLTFYQQMDQLIVMAVDIFVQAEEERQRELALVSSEGSRSDRYSEVAEQELVQLVLQSSDIAVLMIDRNLAIIEANYALAELMGIEREQIIGKNMDEVFRPHDSERFIQWVLERGQSGHYVAEYGGQWTTVSTSPIYHKGDLWGAIAVMRNITDSKRYEEELTKREALAAVGQLAAGMAHEIRNPLTSIKGFIQLLREQSESGRTDSYYSVILTEIERIDGLLNDVLVLARYRDDKMVAEYFEVMDEIYGVIRLLEPEANRRGIKMELQLSDGDWYIHGHRPRIKQAILNILKNSLEALVTQGTLVQISVFASINQVVITIEDNGPGLAEEIKQNLFVPFYTTKPDGTGLGLSTTQRIIIDHGGEIFADNSPKLGGARFEVRLPLAISL
jgi:two-component system sporulation sensor kinase A